MRDRHLLDEQIAFYRARAPEYDQSLGTLAALAPLMRALRATAPTGDAVELACGTGLWTIELLKIAQTVTAIDSSPEMLARNRARIAGAAPSEIGRVDYRVADLFGWAPERQYDLLFAGFWVSHVPPAMVDPFLDTVRAAVRPGGTAFIVDQCNDISDDAQRIEWEGIVQTRRVRDGRTFSIVKVYYHPSLLAARLSRFGFDAHGRRVGESFFSLVGRKRSA